MIQIRTIGIDDYLSGGEIANVRELIFGLPGSGKTLSSSFWPRPLYLSCEGGESVLVGRGIPKEEIYTEEKLKEVGRYLQTKEARDRFDTVLLDTVDGLQDRLVAAFLKRTGKAALDAKNGDYDMVTQPIADFIALVQSLPYNLVVNCHLKKVSRSASDDDKLGGDETAELVGWEPLLQGPKLRDKICGWFDLVGLMENYWGPVDGKRVLKRRVRWEPTPEMPYLKDRFFAFPPTTPVKFAETDYTQLRDLIVKRAGGMSRSEPVLQIGEPDKAAAPDVKGGPVEARPDGVLSKPRSPKRPEKTPEPPEKVENPVSETANHDEAVEAAVTGLGAEVVSDNDWNKQLSEASTVGQVRAIWSAAAEAQELTDELKAELTVKAAALKNQNKEGI